MKKIDKWFSESNVKAEASTFRNICPEAESLGQNNSKAIMHYIFLGQRRSKRIKWKKKTAPTFAVKSLLDDHEALLSCHHVAASIPFWLHGVLSNNTTSSHFFVYILFSIFWQKVVRKIANDTRMMHRENRKQSDKVNILKTDR